MPLAVAYLILCSFAMLPDDSTLPAPLCDYRHLVLSSFSSAILTSSTIIRSSNFTWVCCELPLLYIGMLILARKLSLLLLLFPAFCIFLFCCGQGFVMGQAQAEPAAEQEVRKEEQQAREYWLIGRMVDWLVCVLAYFLLGLRALHYKVFLCILNRCWPCPW